MGLASQAAEGLKTYDLRKIKKLNSKKVLKLVSFGNCSLTLFTEVKICSWNNFILVLGGFLERYKKF